MKIFKDEKSVSISREAYKLLKEHCNRNCLVIKLYLNKMIMKQLEKELKEQIKQKGSDGK